jgi:hypothetical protein
MYDFTDYYELFCGCLCSFTVNQVVKFCEFHEENQPQMGDPLYIYLSNKGKFYDYTEVSETDEELYNEDI